jgi:hypothetical protein
MVLQNLDVHITNQVKNSNVFNLKNPLSPDLVLFHQKEFARFVDNRHRREMRDETKNSNSSYFPSSRATVKDYTQQ